MSEEIVRLGPVVAEEAEAAFNRVAGRLRELLGDVEVHHVGSTAVAGSLSKGDLDVQIRVDADAFDRMKATLSGAYEENRGGFWSEVGASFKDDDDEPPLGIHLTVRDSAADIQWRHTALLRARSDLREAYDALKRPYEGRDMTPYRTAKAAFWDRWGEVGGDD